MLKRQQMHIQAEEFKFVGFWLLVFCFRFSWGRRRYILEDGLLVSILEDHIFLVECGEPDFARCGTSYRITSSIFTGQCSLDSGQGETHIFGVMDFENLQLCACRHKRFEVTRITQDCACDIASIARAGELHGFTYPLDFGNWFALRRTLLRFIGVANQAEGRGVEI